MARHVANDVVASGTSADPEASHRSGLRGRGAYDTSRSRAVPPWSSRENRRSSKRRARQHVGHSNRRAAPCRPRTAPSRLHRRPHISDRGRSPSNSATNGRMLRPSRRCIRTSTTCASPITIGRFFEAMALRESALDCPIINPANTVWINGIDREACVRGITVMLKRPNGQHDFSYDGGELLAAQLRSCRLFAAARTIRNLRRVGGRSWLGLLGDVADAVFPATARRTLRRAVGTPEPIW